MRFFLNPFRGEVLVSGNVIFQSFARRKMCASLLSFKDVAIGSRLNGKISDVSTSLPIHRNVYSSCDLNWAVYPPPPTSASRRAASVLLR